MTAPPHGRDGRRATPPPLRVALVSLAVALASVACSAADDEASTATPASTTGSGGCADALRELARRDILGQFDWGEEDEDGEDLSPEQFEALVDRHEAAPVPYPTDIADPDGPRSTLPGQPNQLDLGDVEDGSLLLALETCWQVQLLTDEDERRIWDEVWSELEAAGAVPDDEEDDGDEDIDDEEDGDEEDR